MQQCYTNIYILINYLEIYSRYDFICYFWCLTPLSAIFQLYHDDQFKWWKKPEYSERTTDHRQSTGKLYHLRLRVECTLFCNLQSRARTHTVLVIGLYELLGNPTTQIIEPPGPCIFQICWTSVFVNRYKISNGCFNPQAHSIKKQGQRLVDIESG